MKRKIVLFMGGLLLMSTLSACSLAKGSRANIEKQFEVLSEIYPTKNVNDLKKKFPEGFRLVNIKNIGDMTYSVILENEASSHDIKGFFKVRQSSSTPTAPTAPTAPTVLLETEIEVDNNGKLLPREEIPVKYANEFDNFTFLFEKLELSKETVSTFKYHTHSTNTNSGYFISYHITNPDFAQYFDIAPNNIQLVMSGNFGYERDGEFGKNVELRTNTYTIEEDIRSKGLFKGE